jgi:hypothetical protein
MRVLAAVWDGYCPQAMIHASPTDSSPLLASYRGSEPPSRAAAAQRRAMHAAIADAVRAMRSTRGQRPGGRAGPLPPGDSA